MPDIFEGAKQLLIESIEIIGDSINDVILVGGWGPYIRHPNEHPGTRDVDLLFPLKYSRDDVINVLENFLSHDYYISAKHDFQLCRAIKLGEQNYIYNIDLLHPTEGKINKVDFLEIMDLDVTDGIRVKKILSVNIQYGSEIYSNDLFESVEYEGKQFNVLDGAGIVVSKLNSCHNKKRTRDIFDIFLSIQEVGTINKLIQLSQTNYVLRENFEDFNNKIETDWDFYKESLEKFGVQNPQIEQVLIK